MSQADHDSAIDAALQLLQAGRVEAARDALQTAAARFQGSAEPWRLLGVIALQQGDVAGARTALARAHAAAPRSPEVLCNLGALERAVGNTDAAERHYREAIAHDGRCVPALNNLAGLLFDAGRMAEAETMFRAALAIAPAYAPARGNLAGCLLELGRTAEALREAQQAAREAPHYAPAWFALAGAQLASSQFMRARQAFEQALQLGMRTPEVLYGLAQALDELDEWPLVLAACEAVLRLDARHAAAASLAQYTRRRLCQHDDVAQGHRQLLALLADGVEGLAPFAFLSEPATPAQQRQVATKAAAAIQRRIAASAGVAPGGDGAEIAGSTGRNHLPATAAVDGRVVRTVHQHSDARDPGHRPRDDQLDGQSRPAQPPVDGSVQDGPETPKAGAAGDDHRIRVGFISSGFGQHPTALLIVELIERLAGSRIETIGYAITPDDGGPLRQRLARAFAGFRDLSGSTHSGMARRIRDDAPDILVDLRGWGGGSVAPLLALRPAPVQVNWLAYPGTSGAPWIDYLIADRYVIPDAERAHFSEALVRLPRCFQPSDTTRIVGEPPPRAQLGLPEDGIVFACFNNSYKYSPESLARFWRVLAQVPGSVLWLLSGRRGETVQANLRRAASAAGIDAARLVFLPKQAHDAYLACYRHADLFLDTTPYNAHTTASDALWAGCPVLTLPGRTFASRVAGSLNHGLGLDDLNAGGDEEFVATAVQLATDREALAAVRRRLDDARRGSPLFDMAGFSRDFKRALLEIAGRHRAGEAPADLDLA